MFKSIKHKLNNYKTNPSTFVYEIDQLNENVLNPLTTNKEGIYGVEVLYQKDYIESYIIAPSHYKEIDGIISPQDWEMLKNTHNLHGYEIEFQQPSFMPLGESDFPLWEYLRQLSNSSVDIMVQLLIYNGTKDWKQNWIDQYIHWIQGNDFPSESKIARQIQGKLLQGINRITRQELSHTRNPHIEYKIKDHGYRFSFRFLLHGSNGLVKVIEDEIQEILSNWDFFNQLRLYKVDDIGGLVEQFIKREMNVRTNQIVSETELIGLFMSDVNSMSQKHNYSLEKTIQVSKVDQLHSGLELLPRNQSTNREIDISIGDAIVSAIRELGLAKNKHLEILNQTRSATLQKVIMKIPKGLRYTDIEKNHKEMKVKLGYEAFTIEQGDEPGTVCFSIPCEDREIVYLRDLLESNEFKQFNKDAILPIIIGMDSQGDPLVVDLSDIVHLLVSGATGSGKSVFLNCLILTFILMRKPNEIQLYLVDPKRVEFTQFNGFPHVKEVITELSEAEQLMNSLLVEMDSRYKLMAKDGVRKIVQYNKKHPQKKIPYLVIVIDEFNSLKQQYPEVEGYIERLGGEARAAGIHLIIATQNPKADVISTVIKSNLPSAISFRQKNNRDYVTIFGSGIPYTLMGKGDGVAKLEGQLREFERFQGAAISLDEDEEQKIYDELKAMNGNKMDNNEAIIEENRDKQGENEEEPIEKLKRIIIETGETRVAELQKMMNISINTVHQMRKKLLADGWLVEVGYNKYEIADSVNL